MAWTLVVLSLYGAAIEDSNRAGATFIHRDFNGPNAVVECNTELTRILGDRTTPSSGVIAVCIPHD